MSEIPYMMANTRAEFERVRNLAWPTTDRPHLAVDRAALIAVIDSMHEGAAERHWAEAEELPRALGWPDGSDRPPNGAWIRARLDEVLRASHVTNGEPA